MTIELRLSNVDPPTAEPKRTIYRDIVNLPDPVKLGITVRYFNYDSVTLYFQITGAGSGYTFGTVNLGALGAGANAYANLDEFASRAKPSTERTDTITLILKAYTDSGYTNLKWTYTKTVTVKFINSADPSYTTDVLNNFDDGTLQGWTYTNETGQTPSGFAVASDYVLSPPYSAKMTEHNNGSEASRGRINKSVTTPNKDTVYAIMDIRNAVSPAGGTGLYLKNVRVSVNTTLLIYLGRPYDTVTADYMVRDKWIRMVVPLPKNTTLELRITQEVRSAGLAGDGFLWLDDFKIISK